MINFMETLAEYKDDIHTLAKALDLSPSDISKLWYQVLAELNEGNISSLQVEAAAFLILLRSYLIQIVLMKVLILEK